MRSAKSRIVPIRPLQFVSSAAARWIFVCIVTALAPACGTRAVDLDGNQDGGSVNVNSNPDAIAPGVTAFLEDQPNASKIAVDEKRVYWLELVPEYCCAPAATVTAGVRSCLKSDCRSTITTYDSLTYSNGDGEILAYVALAAAGDNVYWARNDRSQVASGPTPPRAILTCPSAGCVGAPRVIASAVHLTSMAADESHVYWTSSQDSAVFRLPVSKAGVPEQIALNETDPDQLVLSGSHAYWIERAGVANSAIKRVRKQGGEPVETLAMAQNQATALSVDSEFVYWANTYSVGGILRCKLSGCPSGPEVMVANEPWIHAVAKDGPWISWITAVGGPDPHEQVAAVRRCPIDDCATAVETLAVQIFDLGGMSMAVDGTDLYWVAQGLSIPTSAYATFPHATIYRHKN